MSLMVFDGDFIGFSMHCRFLFFFVVVVFKAQPFFQLLGFQRLCRASDRIVLFCQSRS